MVSKILLSSVMDYDYIYWFRSYLYSRISHVSFCGTLSWPTPGQSGLPNGSVLRTLGFNISINEADLFNVDRFSNYLLWLMIFFFWEINSLRDSLLFQLDISSVRCLMDGSDSSK